MRNKTLQVEKMLEIENWIESMHDTIFCDSISDEGLLKKLNLKLEYVEKVELEYYTFVHSQFYQPYYVFYIDPDSEYVESFEAPGTIFK